MSDKQTVLAIDDVPANLKLLGQILGPQYRFLFATGGLAGLDIALNQRPDIILLDVMMPEVDGHEICKRLKANALTQSIPVIFITALKEETDEATGLEIGAIDYITKPFCPAIIQARVRNHLELKRYRDLLEGLAATDGLTGIPNRRQFDQTLEREWRSAIRRKSEISLILIDIDFFKLYNDRYGHLQGDECLRAVGQAVGAGARRPNELVARYGGEEFACILPDTDVAGAAHVAQELLERVRALEIPHEGSTASPHVTLSLGVASLSPSVGDAASTLIEAADARLYAAKKAGRNQVASCFPDRDDFVSLLKVAKGVLSIPEVYDAAALTEVSRLLDDFKAKMVLDSAFGISPDGSPEHQELLLSFGRLYEAMTRLLHVGPDDEEWPGFGVPLRPRPSRGDAGHAAEPPGH